MNGLGRKIEINNNTQSVDIYFGQFKNSIPHGIASIISTNGF